MFTKDSMTVDLYYGNVLLGSTQTDKENQFLFKGIFATIASHCAKQNT